MQSCREVSTKLQGDKTTTRYSRRSNFYDNPYLPPKKIFQLRWAKETPTGEETAFFTVYLFEPRTCLSNSSTRACSNPSPDGMPPFFRGYRLNWFGSFGIYKSCDYTSTLKCLSLQANLRKLVFPARCVEYMRR